MADNLNEAITKKWGREVEAILQATKNLERGEIVVYATIEGIINEVRPDGAAKIIRPTLNETGQLDDARSPWSQIVSKWKRQMLSRAGVRITNKQNTGYLLMTIEQQASYDGDLKGAMKKINMEIESKSWVAKVAPASMRPSIDRQIANDVAVKMLLKETAKDNRKAIKGYQAKLLEDKKDE